MTPEDVARAVRGTGFMSLEKGIEMTSFIREHHLTRVLELGFAHGVSTCYIASAVLAEGGGSVVSIDLPSARLRSPSAEDLLARCGCRDLVSLHYEPTSYNWSLMRMLEAAKRPQFDLCFIDGAHSWEVDGFAFFLVDQLLAPGGWIIFDDLEWTFASSPTASGTERVQLMPENERTSPQVGKVYQLLVRTHPGYGNFRVWGQWAYAQKISASPSAPPIRTEFIFRESMIDRLWRRLISASGSRFSRRPWRA